MENSFDEVMEPDGTWQTTSLYPFNFQKVKSLKYASDDYDYYRCYDYPDGTNWLMRNKKKPKYCSECGKQK